jgi:hypothetical protein
MIRIPDVSEKKPKEHFMPAERKPELTDEGFEKKPGLTCLLNLIISYYCAHSI